MAVRVLKGGMLSSIQDLGRFGFQRYGMTVCGAMDTLALRLGNIILANKEEEAGIECTGTGLSLYFEQVQLICITGADLSPNLDGQPIPLWKPIVVPEGATLTFGRPKWGVRSYICFFGGLAVPVVLGSKSTYLKGAIGGWNGRALKKDDQIAFNNPYKGRQRQFGWHISPTQFMDYTTCRIRVIAGPQFEQFDGDNILAFLSNTFTITQFSDRMGYRLTSDPLKRKETKENLSMAVTFGTIQVPADGHPIILMADHPTTGGYPIIAQVATVDLPILAQLAPHDQIAFDLISLDEAQELLVIQINQLNQLKKMIAFKYE